MIAMIGTSDRLCWLAETCKILLPSSALTNAPRYADQFCRRHLLQRRRDQVKSGTGEVYTRAFAEQLYSASARALRSHVGY